MSKAPPAEIPRLDLGEVERMQADLLRLVDQLTAEPDADRQAQLVRAIGDRSDQLRGACEKLEAKARAAAREIRGKIEVALTAAQQQEVRQRTGVALTTIDIPDGGGLVAAMPQMTREQVMVYAVEEAERRKRRAEARQAARAELDRIRDELKSAPEQVRLEIERMLADPELRRAFDEPGE